MDDWRYLAGALVGSIGFGYFISWVLDRLILKRLIEDRLSGIALSYALTFVLLMAATTAYLTMTSPFPERPVIIPPIGFFIAFVAGLGLAGALRIRAYSAEYEHNDDQAVFDVDDSDQSLYDDEVLRWDEKHGHRNYLYRHWVGHLSLPVSYWVNSALLSAVLLAATELLIRMFRVEAGSLRGVAIVALLFLFLSLVLWVWSSVGVWRSAYWHRRRSGAPGWGYAARALVAIGAVGLVIRADNVALQAREWGYLALGHDPLGSTAKMSVSRDGQALIVNGLLSQGVANKFEELLDAVPGVKQIILTSEGGRMFEAVRMAAMIRKRGLDTRVDDYCISACTNVLLAGAERTAPNRARIGFHQPRFPGVEGGQLRVMIEQMRSEYLAAGVNPQFVWRALMTPADGMWFPSSDQLIAANVLTGSDIVITASGTGHRSRTKREVGDESLSDKRLRLDIEAEAKRINASAPVKVDTFTTLDRASAAGLTLSYFYTVRADNVDVASAKRNITPLLRRENCGNPLMQAAIRDGATLVYSYRNTAGRHLFDIAISGCREA